MSFPLYRSIADEGYVNKINRFRNRQIPAEAIRSIEAAQPQNAGNEPLWWLHELVNTDKHRMPLLTVGVAHVMRDVSIVITANSSRRRSAAQANISSSLSIVGTAADIEHVEVDGEAIGFVAFQDVSMPREPIDRTLDQIVECVANVVPQFERFFP